jgi:hypothetical protein
MRPRDDPSGHHETERLRRRVELEPSRATFGAGSACVGFYCNGAHRVRNLKTVSLLTFPFVRCIRMIFRL